ncbi:MAG: hypothetical protein E7663_06865 [Ruminococcaceae bacterium]|nr:hypothetical protein [Oscillospiraceae bacterium]
MIRGCQRETVYLRTQDSDLFECAWLVLRREKPMVGADDMLAEANRIVGQGAAYSGKRRHRLGGFLLFLSGASFSAAVLLLLYVFLGA